MYAQVLFAQGSASYLVPLQSLLRSSISSSGIRAIQSTLVYSPVVRARSIKVCALQTVDILGFSSSVSWWILQLWGYDFTKPVSFKWCGHLPQGVWSHRDIVLLCWFFQFSFIVFCLYFLSEQEGAKLQVFFLMVKVFLLNKGQRETTGEAIWEELWFGSWGWT